MMYLLLVIAGALPQTTLPLPQCTLPALVAPAPKAKPAARPAPVRSGQYREPPSYHRHRDSRGNVWEHHDSNFGKVAPHRSPWTGELVWPIYHGLQAPSPYGPQSAAPRRSFAPVQACPT